MSFNIFLFYVGHLAINKNELSVYHKHIFGAGNRIQVQTLVSIGFTLTLSLWVELSGKNTLSE